MQQVSKSTGDGLVTWISAVNNYFLFPIHLQKAGSGNLDSQILGVGIK